MTIADLALTALWPLLCGAVFVAGVVLFDHWIERD